MLRISKYRKTIVGCSAIFTASIASFVPAVSANQTNRFSIPHNSSTTGKTLLIAQITNNSNASGFNVSNPAGGITGIPITNNSNSSGTNVSNAPSGTTGIPGTGGTNSSNSSGTNVSNAPGGTTGIPGTGGTNSSNSSGTNVSNAPGGTTGIPGTGGTNSSNSSGTNVSNASGSNNSNSSGSNTGANNNNSSRNARLSAINSRFSAALANYERAAAVLAQEQSAQPNASSSAPVRYSRQAGDLADCGCLNKDTANKGDRPELIAARAAEAEAAAELAKANAEARQFLESVKNEIPTASVMKAPSPLW